MTKREKKNTQGRGRPAKATFEEKKAIIDAFFISEGGENPGILLQHGIYTRLATFHLSRQFGLYPHDFSKDKGIVEYMQSLAANSLPPSDTAALPTYTPLDLNAVLSKSVPEQIKIFRTRDDYYKEVHHRAAKAISSYVDLSKQVDLARSEKKKLELEIDELSKELTAEKAKSAAAEREIATLRRYIRQHVEPAIAEAFIKDLASTDRTEIPSIASATVMGKIASSKQGSKAGSVLDLFEKK